MFVRSQNVVKHEIWEKLRIIMMWSGASVAHTTPVRKDLGSILTQTQDGILIEKLSSPFFQTTYLKTISFICDIVILSWNK